MQSARDIMRPPVFVQTHTPVSELGKLLLEQGVDGAAVVHDGRLVGVVTSMDLIFQEKKVHVPTFFVLLDAVIPLESPRRTRKELEKIGARTVEGIMTPNPVTVRPDTPLDELASHMVEEHITILPVLEDGELVGMVTKTAVLGAVAGVRG